MTGVGAATLTGWPRVARGATPKDPACGEEFSYVTACHHVIVTPDRDDLIDHAARAAQVGRNPRIVLYDDTLPTMTLFQWRALGRPVHGVKKVS